MINRHLLALFDELRAEGVGDPLAQSFTLAALWDDLAALAGEPPPLFVHRALGGSRAASRQCAPDRAVDPCPYRPPVDTLLGLGASGIADGTWLDYRALGLGAGDVPQLLRLALDPRHHLTEGDDHAVYAPVYACAALGQLGATAALPLLAELPRLFADDWLWQGLLALATGLGPPSIPALRSVLGTTAAGWDVREALADAVERDLGDWFAFAIGPAMADLDGPPGGGARFPVACRLDGRIFAEFHVDVALGDGVMSQPEQLAGHDFLGFAGIPPAQLAVLPAAQHFAEKVHAFAFPWRDRPNTRVRDLIDLVLLIDTGLLEPAATVTAVQLTFARRATHPLPAKLPPPEEWATPFAALAEEMKLAEQTTEAAFARGHVLHRDYQRRVGFNLVPPGNC